MSTFEHKNSLRTIEAQIVQKLKNNEARPKFTGSYKKKRVLNWLLPSPERKYNIIQKRFKTNLHVHAILH